MYILTQRPATEDPELSNGPIHCVPPYPGNDGPDFGSEAAHRQQTKRGDDAAPLSRHK